ncbi:MAG TPA: hypothetical protein VF008_23245, partial [Niastella sp.]
MKRSIFLALVCVTFFSCDKENDGPPAVIIPGTLAKEFFHKQIDQVRTFYYNKDTTLDHYDYTFDSVLTERFRFRYSGKLPTSIDYYDPKISGGPVRQQLPKYDKQNRLSEIIVFINADWDTLPTPKVYPFKYEFLYDNESSTRFSTCVSYRRTNNVLVPFGETHFEYDNQGNIIILENYTIENGIKTKRFVTIYEYLQQKNPKHRLDDILDFENYFSPNIWERKTV